MNVSAAPWELNKREKKKLLEENGKEEEDKIVDEYLIDSISILT